MYNTIGLRVNNSQTSPLLATVANDIFWQNHDQTTARNGFGIEANTPNSLLVRNSLFQSNGKSDTSRTFAGLNVGNGFVAANLKATPDALGNYTGNPSFVFPIDPRPGSDGPAAFYLDANFDLQANSAAIDAANRHDHQRVTSSPRRHRLPRPGPRPDRRQGLPRHRPGRRRGVRVQGDRRPADRPLRQEDRDPREATPTPAKPTPTPAKSAATLALAGVVKRPASSPPPSR